MKKTNQLDFRYDKTGYNIECIDIPKEFKNSKSFHIYMINNIRNSKNEEIKKQYLDTLFKSIYKFIYKELDLYKSIENDKCELLQYASISFMKAVNSYDESKGFGFLTLLSKIMRNEIYMAYYIRSEDKDRSFYRFKNGINSLSLDEFIIDDYDKSPSEVLYDNGTYVEDIVINNSIKNDIFDFVDNMNLSKLQIDIYKYYITNKLNYNDFTHTQIANKFNVHRSYVSRIVKKINKELKNNIFNTTI